MNGVLSKKQWSVTGVTMSPPIVPEICACALPAGAENPAAAARIASIVPSLDRDIRFLSC